VATVIYTATDVAIVVSGTRQQLKKTISAMLGD